MVIETNSVLINIAFDYNFLFPLSKRANVRSRTRHGYDTTKVRVQGPARLCRPPKLFWPSIVNNTVIVLWSKIARTTIIIIFIRVFRVLLSQAYCPIRSPVHVRAATDRTVENHTCHVNLHNKNARVSDTGQLVWQ